MRELKQTVRSAVLLTEGRLIGADRLEAESTTQAGSSLLLKDGNEERERIVRALAQADGNREVTGSDCRTAGYQPHDPVQQDERIRYHAEKERKMRKSQLKILSLHEHRRNTVRRNTVSRTD